MKIELEIDDTLARTLAFGSYWAGDEMPSEDSVRSAAQLCLRRYAHRPDLVERKHLNALAIVRAQAVQAAATSTTEASRLEAAETAQRLLRLMLDSY